jgi:hypothetical protein
MISFYSVELKNAAYAMPPTHRQKRDDNVNNFGLFIEQCESDWFGWWIEMCHFCHHSFRSLKITTTTTTSIS